MPLAVKVIHGVSSRAADVTRFGQLVVGPLAYDDTKFLELNSTGTAFSFFPSISGQQFVITGMRIKADRNVSNTADAEIIVYEASSAASITVDRTLHEEALIRGEAVTLIPMNLLVNAGKYVNAKTSDVSIFITIMGYYVGLVN